MGKQNQVEEFDLPASEEKSPATANGARQLPLWWVILEVEPGTHKSLSPYMDVPRIFRCEEYRAVELFKKFYGIRATEHSFRTEPATEGQLAAQNERDKKHADGVRFTRDEILSAAGLSATATASAT
jgi:hypothetical protein